LIVSSMMRHPNTNDDVDEVTDFRLQHQSPWATMVGGLKRNTFATIYIHCALDDNEVARPRRSSSNKDFAVRAIPIRNNKEREQAPWFTSNSSRFDVWDPNNPRQQNNDGMSPSCRFQE
jgi:hypothetical protein